MSYQLHSEDDFEGILSKENTITLSKELLRYVISTLKKVPKARYPEDIDFLRQCTQCNLFLQSILQQRGEDCLNDLLKHLKYQFQKSGEILFEAGSIGSTFYLILEGTVDVNTSSINMTEDEPEIELKKVLELKPGSCFGELPLLEGAQKPRSVTMVCKTDCHLGILDGKAYKDLIGAMERKKLTAAADFLGASPVFKGLSHYTLKVWVNLFENKESYPKNCVVYNEGDESENIYFIRSGFVISKKLVSFQQKALEGDDAVTNGESQLYVIGRPPPRKYADLFVLGPGELFGEEEAFASYDRAKKARIREGEDNPNQDLLKKKLHVREWEAKLQSLSTKRTSTMIVVSAKAEIWKMSKKEFFSKMEASTRLFRNLIETIFVKKERRDERIQEIQSGMSEYEGYIEKKRGNAFKQDICGAIKLKKFLKNNQPDLRKFLESRCSMTFDKEEEEEEQDLTRNQDSEKESVVADHMSFNSTAISFSGKKSPFSLFRGTGNSRPESQNKWQSVIAFEDQDTMSTDMPGNMTRLKFDFQNDESYVGEARSKRSVRASSCVRGSQIIRSSLAMEHCYQAKSSLDTAEDDNSKENYNIITAGDWNLFPSTMTSKATPSPKEKGSVTETTEYLVSKQTTSKFVDVISPGMVQYLKQRTLVAPNKIFIRRPQRVNERLHSYVRTSVENSLAVTNRGLTVSKRSRNQNFSSRTPGAMITTSIGSRRNSLEEEKTGYLNKSTRRQELSPITKAEGLKVSMKPIQKERSVHRTIRMETPVGAERSRLFYQARNDVFGRRLVKFANTAADFMKKENKKIKV